MAINEHVSQFAGLPVAEFDPDKPLPVEPGAAAWRIETDYDGGVEGFERLLSALLAADWAGQVTALVIGEWGESYDTAAPVERLVAAAGTLTGLRALFLGDMTYEENEISWIKQTDVTPAAGGLPARWRCCGCAAPTGLELTPVRHEALRELAIESGGLPADVVRGGRRVRPARRCATWSCGSAPTTTAATPRWRTWRRSWPARGCPR